MRGIAVCLRGEKDYFPCRMETDPKKIRELRLNMPHQTSEEARRQFEEVQREALRLYETGKLKDSETGRVRED